MAKPTAFGVVYPAAVILLAIFGATYDRMARFSEGRGATTYNIETWDSPAKCGCIVRILGLATKLAFRFGRWLSKACPCIKQVTLKPAQCKDRDGNDVTLIALHNGFTPNSFRVEEAKGGCLNHKCRRRAYGWYHPPPRPKSSERFQVRDGAISDYLNSEKGKTLQGQTHTCIDEGSQMSPKAV